MTIYIKTKQREYPIYIDRGCLEKVSELLPGDGTPFIISDSGVPEKWKSLLKRQLPDAKMYVFEQGEHNKNLRTYESILRWLASNHASRKDYVIALGGGVTGDMAGFAAATYMRGIRYINIPTTMLSQIDSSIGGKTAVDLGGLKNLVGAFWQPAAVIIDPCVLDTLPARQLAAGLAEAVKSGMIRDRSLFEKFETENYADDLDDIIYRSLMVKKAIVEEDELENSVRKLLNFGHTFGHAIESFYEGEYLHGECVAMGMMKVVRDSGIRHRLRAVLDRLDLPASCDADPEKITELILSDKKMHAGTVDMVMVDEIGNGHIESKSIDKIRVIASQALDQ